MGNEYAVLSYCICCLSALLAADQGLASGECSYVARKVQALVHKCFLFYSIQTLGLVSKESKHSRGADVKLNPKCYIFPLLNHTHCLAVIPGVKCCQYILWILSLSSRDDSCRDSCLWYTGKQGTHFPLSSGIVSMCPSLNDHSDAWSLKVFFY